MRRTLLYRLDATTGTRTPVFEVDNVVSASTANEVQLTDNPVEDGSVLTDHEARKPDTHTVEVVVTDRPPEGGYFPGRARDAWEALKDLRRLKDTLVLVLPLVGDQLSVRLIRAEPTLNVQTSFGELRVSLTFREVEVATSQRVPAQKRKQTNAKPKVELGQQSTTPTGLDEDGSTAEERARTLTKQIITAFRGRR